MIYIPKKRLQVVEAGIRAWKSFKETSKKLAEFNLTEALQEKKR